MNFNSKCFSYFFHRSIRNQTIVLNIFSVHIFLTIGFDLSCLFNCLTIHHIFVNIVHWTNVETNMWLTAKSAQVVLNQCFMQNLSTSHQLIPVDSSLWFSTTWADSAAHSTSNDDRCTTFKQILFDCSIYFFSYRNATRAHNIKTSPAKIFEREKTRQFHTNYDFHLTCIYVESMTAHCEQHQKRMNRKQTGLVWKNYIFTI